METEHLSPTSPSGRRVASRTPLEAISVSAVVLDGYPPVAKQVPVVLLFVAAIVLTAVVPTITVTSAAALVVAVIGMASATALAAVQPRLDPVGRAVVLVPMLDFVLVGVLRFATGESASIFAAATIPPLVWTASLPGRRYVLYALAGICAGLEMPFLLGATLEGNPNELARGIFSTVALVLAAVAINALARLGRARIRDVGARQQRTRVELAQASAVQQALLPKGDRRIDGYDLAGFCLPSRAISGDFFDWYPAGRGTAFTLGDVMGKGVGAGIIAATLRAVIRSARTDEDPAVALTRASRALASDLADTGSFATALHGRLDERTGVVRYIDAGHGLSLHVRADGSWERLTSDDVPIGILPDEPWTINTLRLEPGDTLISCSDGILDLYDGTAESLAHVAYIVSLSSGATNAVARLRALIDDSDSREDDVTILVLSRSVQKESDHPITAL